MSHWIFVTRYPAEEGKTNAHEHVHYYYLEGEREGTCHMGQGLLKRKERLLLTCILLLSVDCIWCAVQTVKITP